MTYLIIILFFVSMIPSGIGASPFEKGTFPSHPAWEGCQTCHNHFSPSRGVTEGSCNRCHSRPFDISPEKSRPGSDVPVFPVVLATGEKQGEEMILIPGGPFIMGYDHRHPDEMPAHTVSLEPFFIDAKEVTNRKYKQFVDQTGRRPPDHWNNGTFLPDREAYPVSFVTWYDARDYCTWEGKRLPTEAEWEKAARGTDGRLFPWGNEFDPKKANTPQSRLGGTTPVGTFSEGKSPYGLYDMGGNVWEWTDSWAVAYPGNPRPKAHYFTGGYKVLKGGSWVDCSFYRCGISAFTFNRGYFKPETKNRGFGFRCAKSPS